jgi:hypothetical protein
MLKSQNTKTIKLDLGCSFHKRDGFVGVDILKSKDIDILADASKLPLKTDCVSEIYSSYALEHIQDQLAVIHEMWRVCSDGAKITLILPHFSNPAYYDDLTHKYLYSTRTFEHYDQELHELTGHPNYLPEVNLKVTKAELRWWPPQVIERKSRLKQIILNTLNGVINYLANAHPFLCERIWCRWVGGFYEVDFSLKVRK